MNFHFAGRWTIVALTSWLLAGVLFPTFADAQRPSFGGRGGFDRGGGGDRGSFGGPSSFLSRMDTNGNGVLEPDEMQGRARGFLERMVQNIPGMDLNRPIPIDRLSQAFERMRQERFGGSRDRDDDNRDRGRGGSSSSRSGGSSSSEAEPLVPGFGEPLILDPVPGFGTAAEAFAVRIEESDYREADQTLARDDRNKDGVLDQDEIRRGRWRDDPLRQDRNGDGKLSRAELALRYAMRRTQREDSSSGSSRGGSRSSSSSSRSSSSSSRSSSSSSRSSSSGGDPRLEGLLRSVYERYDRNRSGVFERDEWESFRTNPSDADKNRDGKITRSEMSDWLQQRYLSRSGGGWGGRSRGDDSGGRGGWFGRGGGDGSGGDSQGGGEQAPANGTRRIVGKSRRDEVAFNFRSSAELLPDDIPDWFTSLDANQDGQVAMSEYKASWTERDIADFAQFDLNGDGIIRPDECMAATSRGAVRGNPSTTLVASSAGASDSVNGATSSSGGAPATSASTSSGSDAAGGGEEDRYIRYAVGYIRRYDEDGDGMLVQTEWSKMSRDYSEADTDKDGKITPAELAAAMQQR